MKRLATKITLVIGLTAFAVWLSPFMSANRQDQPRDSQVIGYRHAGSQDAVAQLQRRINSGEVKLEYSEIPAADRKAVLEIPRATKRNLPTYFQ